MNGGLGVGSAAQIIINLTFVLQGKLMPTQKSGFFPSSCVKPFLDPKVKPSFSCVTGKNAENGDVVIWTAMSTVKSSLGLLQIV